MIETTIPREQMPQIDEKDIPALLVYIGNLGYRISAGHASTENLHVGQPINAAKARGIASRPDVLFKPILVANDNYVLDGNHRWAAHMLNKTLVRYIAIDVSFEDGIELLRSFPKAYELTSTTPERN